MIGLLLLAFGLRVFRLDGQSMWSDEGLTLYRAQQSVSGILSNTIRVGVVSTQDTSPPLYFLIVAGVRALAGESIFALRFVSVVFGVLSVAVLFALGRALFSIRVGLVAALLLAVSPFYVFYSQEMRNYSLLIFLNLASAYLLWRMLSTSGRRRVEFGLAWLAISVAMVYTHYFALFVLAFELAVLLLSTFKREAGRRMVLLVGAIIAIALPLVPFGLSRLLAGPQVDFYPRSGPEILQFAVTAFALGIVPETLRPWLQLVPYLTLAALGAFLVWRQRPYRKALLYVLAYLCLPLALLIGISQITPIFNGVRHTLFALPPFLLLLACALASPRGRVALLSVPVLAILLVVQGQHLQQQYFGLVVDDVRGAAEYLTQATEPDDVVVLHDELISFVFRYYYHGPAPVFAVPGYGESDVAAAETEIQQLSTTHHRLWFLQQPEPRNGFSRSALPQWMDSNLIRVSSLQFRYLWLPVGLVQYRARLPVSDTLPAGATPIYQIWPPGIQWMGCAWLTPKPHAGEMTHLVLYWKVSHAVSPDPWALLQLVDSKGHESSQLVAKLYETAPMETWPVDKIVAQDVYWELPASLAPDRYRLMLRLDAVPEVKAVLNSGNTGGWTAGCSISTLQ